MDNTFDITVIQGDTYKWAMYLKDVGGTAYNLSGCTLTMQIRKGYYPAPLIATYTTSIPAGTTLAQMPEGIFGGLSGSAIGGTIYVAIGSTYSGQLNSSFTSRYDIQLQNSLDNNVITLLRGAIQTANEVTRL